MTNVQQAAVVTTRDAWDLIGFDGTRGSFDHDWYTGEQYHTGEVDTSSPYSVRVKGGRTLYEAVGNNGGDRVRLSRLDATDGLRVVVRYVAADATLEVVQDEDPS